MSDHARRGTKAAVPLFCLFFLLCGFSPAVAETRPETVTLAQAIRAALQDGLDAKIAGLDLQTARAQYDQAAAQSSVSLDGTASAGYSKGTLGTADSLAAGISFSLPQTMTSADLTASYSITRDDFGAELSVGQTIWDGTGSPLDGGKGAASLRRLSHSEWFGSGLASP